MRQQLAAYLQSELEETSSDKIEETLQSSKSMR